MKFSKFFAEFKHKSKFYGKKVLNLIGCKSKFYGKKALDFTGSAVKTIFLSDSQESLDQVKKRSFAAVFAFIFSILLPIIYLSSMPSLEETFAIGVNPEYPVQTISLLTVSYSQSDTNEVVEIDSDYVNEVNEEKEAIRAKEEAERLEREAKEAAEKAAKEEAELKAKKEAEAAAAKTAPSVPSSPNFVYYSSIPLSYDWQNYTFNVCQEYGISYEVMLGLMNRECGFNLDWTTPSATNDWGICQINICNEEYALRLGFTEWKKPEQNIRLSALILSTCLNYDDVAGNYHKALMSYNMGHGGARNKFAQGIYQTAYSQGVISFAEALKNS